MLKAESWNFDKVLVALVISIIGATSLLLMPQSDTGWLLRAGQDIWQTRTVSDIETYSFTARGNYWPNHEWLSEVVMYGLFWLGSWPLLIIGIAVIVWLTWFGIYRLCVGPPYIRAIALLLGVVANSPSWGLRPQIFSLGFTILLLSMITQRRWHYWIPVLMLVWANFHGGFATGFILLTTACGAALWRFRAEWWHWVAITGMSALATLVNPHGYRLWLLAIKYLDYPLKAYLSEWQSPFQSGVDTIFYIVYVGLAAAALWFSRQRRFSHADLTLALTVAMLAVMSASVVRHVSVMVLVLTPILTWPFADRSSLADVPARQGRLNQVLIGVVSGVLIGAVVWTLNQRPPLLQPQLVGALNTCNGPVFNSLNVGGQLIWYNPDRAVFIDNRNDPYDVDFYVRSLFAEQADGHEALFAEYGITCAVLETPALLTATLVNQGWQVVHQDSQFSVLAAP